MTETVRAWRDFAPDALVAAASLLAQHRLAEAQPLVRGRGRAISAPTRRRSSRAVEPSPDEIYRICLCCPGAGRLRADRAAAADAGARLPRTAARGRAVRQLRRRRARPLALGPAGRPRALGGDRRPARHGRLRQRLPPGRAVLGRARHRHLRLRPARLWPLAAARRLGRRCADDRGPAHHRAPWSAPAIPHAIIAVAGESLGGAVAIEAFASDRPPAADRLVLAAPAVWGWSSQPLAYQLALCRRPRTSRPAKVFTPPGFVTEHISASDNIPELERDGPRPADDLGRALRRALRPGEHHAARLARTSAASARRPSTCWARTTRSFRRSRRNRPPPACRPAIAPPTTPKAGTCCCATSRPTTSATTSPPSSATQPRRCPPAPRRSRARAAPL